MALPFTIRIHDEMIKINFNTNTYKQMKFYSKYEEWNSFSVEAFKQSSSQALKCSLSESYLKLAWTLFFFGFESTLFIALNLHIFYMQLTSSYGDRFKVLYR